MFDTILLSARLLLAAVFAVAGLTKAADPRTFRRTLTGFGLSEALAAPLSVGLPALEVLERLPCFRRPSRGGAP